MGFNGNCLSNDAQFPFLKFFKISGSCVVAFLLAERFCGYGNPFPGVLVELIVVLVILAILAAMMVPALLGYIDEARNKEYVLQARSIYMAAQSYADEQYAKSEATLTKADLISEDACKKIGALADVDLDATWLVDCYVAGREGTDAFKIEEMSIKFPGKNDQTAYAALCGGEWTVALSATSSAPADFSPEFNESLIKLSE